MKNKIFIISIIFILISFCFIGNNAFASSTFTFTDRFGNERTVPSFPESDIISSSNSFAVVNTGNYKNTLYVATGDGFFYGGGNVFCSTPCYMIYLVNGEYVIQPNTCTANARLCSASELCYFSTGLYADKDKSSVIIEPGGDFFHLAPLTLGQELEKVEAVEVFKKMTKNVVISLLVCLIGFLSLRKGWTFLKTVLRKA